MKQILSAMLCTILALAMAFPAFAAEQPSEIEAAAAYVREQGITSAIKDRKAPSGGKS